MPDSTPSGHPGLAFRPFARPRGEVQNEFSTRVPISLTMTTFAHNALASTANFVPSSRKASARVALIEIGDTCRAVLSECFRQFGIEPVCVSSDGAGRLKREKFEACVVAVGAASEPILETARTSRSNSRMVIYGLGGSVQQAMKFSKYGINAVFDEPLERQSALKLVRSTQMLVFHEFRRYARIPVITEVSLVVKGSDRYTASSQEISAGGMSLQSVEDLTPGQPLEISFALLTLPRIWVRGTVSWRKPAPKTFGVRFDPQDARRLQIKKWVEAHLESAGTSS
jgi:PilZ domain